MASKKPHDEWEGKRCGARKRGTNEACPLFAVAGRERCRLHGGKTPRGSDLPQYKHGRYSKYLPSYLGERFAAQNSDADLLSLREDISLVGVRVTELLEKLANSESGKLWADLRKLDVDLQKAQLAGDVERASVTLREMHALILRGAEAEEAWQGIYQALAQRRRLVESERRRMVETHQMLTTDEAMSMMSTILDVIQRNVDDPRALRAISAEFEVLMLASSDKALPARTG